MLVARGPQVFARAVVAGWRHNKNPVNRKALSSVSENSLLNSDASKASNKIYHTSFLVLAALTPVAFVLPSWLNLPIDLALGVLFPVHSHIALNYVISDYVPKALRTTARVGLFGATVVTLMGMLKLNLGGPGLTKTLSSLWTSKKKNEGKAVAKNH
jgi:succinate dehydrogenase (ubiquinone) membrane anchor subunit